MTELQGSSTIKGSNGIYHMEWPELRIKATITRVKDNSNNEIHGEIDIKSERPTSAGHLKGGKLNITSVDSRHKWALSLAKRESEVDWDALLEQIYVKVKEKKREGSPVVVIKGKADVVREQAKWVIEPMLQQRNTSLIYGPGSAGKSWFAQYIAVLASAGMNHGGLSVEPSVVLYLDWETDEQELDIRITKIQAGLHLEDEARIYYRSMSESLGNDIERINEICVEYGITLIIVDSVGAACGGEPENAKIVNEFFNALHSLQITTLVIDHTNKEGLLFGSVYKFNRSRLVWEVKKHQNQDDDKLHVGLFHRKSNNSKLMKDLGFELTFTEEAISVERKDVRDTPLEVNMSFPERISNTLRNRDGGLTPQEIAEELQTEGDVRELQRILNHVNKELSNDRNGGIGRWVQLPTKRYALRAREEQYETIGSGEWKPETF